MRGSGDLLVYLDLDGVMHHQAVYQDRLQGIYMSQTEAPGRILFEWAGVLVDILRPYPNIRLVLSSSWCRRPGYRRTLKRLPVELQARFVGGTFHRRVHGADPGAELEFASLPRGVQIANDVARRRPRDWLALDDDDRGWRVEHRGHLVKCDGRLGLSDPATQLELSRRLSSMVCRPLDGGLEVLQDIQRRDAEDVAAGRRAARTLWAIQKGDLDGFAFTPNPNSEFDLPGEGW